jgi:hypothetical protein
MTDETGLKCPNRHTCSLRGFLIEKTFYPGDPEFEESTELPDNPGMSICNAFEDLFLQVVEAYNLDPELIMWIEHWEIWKVSEGAPYDREEEDWHRVEFD